MDFINTVRLSNGTMDEQFEMVKPFDIFDVVIMGPNSLVAAVQYTGLIKWNTREMYGFDWRTRIDPIKYLVAGKDGMILAVFASGDKLAIINEKDGEIIRQSAISGKVNGRPAWDGLNFIVPVEKAVLVVDEELSVTKVTAIEGANGTANLHLTSNGMFVVNVDSVHYLGR